MSTQVQVCNQALTFLGHDVQIVSIFPPDGTREAELLNRYWTTSLETALSEHNWSFATKMVALAQLASPPPHLAWKYAFDLPADMVRPIKFYVGGLAQSVPPSEDIAIYDYLSDTTQIEMGFDPVNNKNIVFSNEPDLWLKYLFVNGESTTWPQPFSNAVSWLLASNIAVPLTKSTDIQATAFKQYKEWLKKAIAQDMEQWTDVAKELIDEAYPVNKTGVGWRWG